MGTAVMTACVTLAACGKDTTVMAGEARPEARKLGIAWKPGQAVGPAQRPNACDLLGKKELQAILPQAESIATKAGPAKVSRFNAAGHNVATERAAHAVCEYEIRLPHRIGRDSYRLNYMRIEIEGVGDPALMAKAFAIRKKTWRREEDGDLAAPGAEECFFTEASNGYLPQGVLCRRGPLMFSVSVTKWPAEFRAAGDDDSLQPLGTFEKRIYPAVIQSVTAKV
ncbi:hypothetical protein ACFVH6_06615 [Spirillospora sp. NPDC127200]